jgi:mannose-6-phosphate isomerase-like protein (cupin superfamily)
VLTLPPDSVYASPAFNPTAAAEEQARIVPGIADRMELEAPGFHTTQTLDYVVVLSGMVWLVVDDGEVQLQAGDVVVQLGSRHAWQNRTEGPATLAVVLMGAERAGG